MKAGGDLYHKQKQLENARLELEQEKKNLQFKKIDSNFSAAHGVPNRELEEYELSLLPLIGRLLKKLFS